ncbi:hypothetical protein GW17_00018264, partial [Ensete ventricosum]
MTWRPNSTQSISLRHLPKNAALFASPSCRLWGMAWSRHRPSGPSLIHRGGSVVDPRNPSRKLSDLFSDRCPRVRNLIGGEFVESQSEDWIDVVNPVSLSNTATQEVVSRVPLTTSEEFKAAVGAAKSAYPQWRNVPLTTRQRIMFKLQELIRRDMDKLALNITTEQGKTLKDAQGDVFRGLEMEELTSLSILPGASMMLAELAKEAGLPDGVLNIVHGTNVSLILDVCISCKHLPFLVVKCAGMHIYARAAAKGKRVQIKVGFALFFSRFFFLPQLTVDGRNRLSMAEIDHRRSISVVLPDSGQSTYRSAGGLVRTVRFGALSLGKANLGLDCVSLTGYVPGLENGNFVGPTILADTTSNMECYKVHISRPHCCLLPLCQLFQSNHKNEEIFGPVLLLMKVGINVPIPVPLPFFSFTGSKASFAGDLNFYGVQFYTQLKTVTQQWKDAPGQGISLAMP